MHFSDGGILIDSVRCLVIQFVLHLQSTLFNKTMQNVLSTLLLLGTYCWLRCGLARVQRVSQDAGIQAVDSVGRH